MFLLGSSSFLIVLQAGRARFLNRMVIEQFIAGLPANYAKQVQTDGCLYRTISACVSYVRRLWSSEGTTTRGPGPGARWMTWGMAAAAESPTPKNCLCYSCHCQRMMS